MLDRHIAWYNDPAAYGYPGLAPLEPDEVAMTRPVVEQLAKVLLKRRRKGAGDRAQRS